MRKERSLRKACPGCENPRCQPCLEKKWDAIFEERHGEAARFYYRPLSQRDNHAPSAAVSRGENKSVYRIA